MICVLGRELLVEAGGDLHRATPAGRLRMRGKREMPVAGDRVRLLTSPQGSPTIVGIEPRTTVFTRAGYKGRIIPVVANIECLVVVVSVAEPAPSLLVVDRFLALGERGQLACAICINKADLGIEPPPGFPVYQRLGYPSITTSATTGEGLEQLQAVLGGRISALVGPSGTGKSSLINALLGTHAQQVQDISARIGRGRHTTTHSRLLPLEGGGYLADTPGISWLGMPPSTPHELALLFPEVRQLHGRCRFADCSHTAEPDCAVKEAASQGRIAPHRYRSYVTLVSEALATAPGSRQTDATR